MKNGDGRFLYLDKGQMYTGFWVNDVAKCGTVEDFDRDSAPEPPKYPIPEVCACSRGREQCCNDSIMEGSVFRLIPLHPTVITHAVFFNGLQHCSGHCKGRTQDRASIIGLRYLSLSVYTCICCSHCVPVVNYQQHSSVWHAVLCFVTLLVP